MNVAIRKGTGYAGLKLKKETAIWARKFGI